MNNLHPAIPRSRRPRHSVVAGTLLTLMIATVATVSANPDVDTPADVIHPDIHDNVGQGAGDNANANPRGQTDNGGQIHGIADTPGQDGDNPNDDGTNGMANELNDVHGGMDEVNPQTEP